jgi:hypothetical protein
MPEFPINYAQGTPSVVKQPRANMNLDTGAGDIARAQSQFGETLFAVGQKIQHAQNAMELSTLQRKSEEINNASLMALQGVDPKDDESIQKIQQKRDTDLKGLTSKSQAVNDTFAMHLNSESPRWDMQFQGQVIQKKAKGAKDDFDLNAQQFLAEGNQAAYLKLLNNARATEVISPQEFDFRANNMTNDSLLAQSESLSLDGNFVAAEERLGKLDNPTVEQKQYREKVSSLARVQIEKAGSEANKQLTDMMASRTLSVTEIQKRRALLPDNDYQSWMKIAMNPADKKGDIIKTAGFKTMAMDVSRGTLSREDAETKIRESLSDPAGINDEQYAAIYSDLDREVKGYQAQDKKTYSIDATRLILGKDSGVMTFDALGNVTIDINKMLSPQAEFERKMHFVDLYNNEMSNFIADNPKVSKKDLYIKSQELKETYTRAARGDTPKAGLSEEKEKRRQELLRKAGK